MVGLWLVCSPNSREFVLFEHRFAPFQPKSTTFAGGQTIANRGFAGLFVISGGEYYPSLFGSRSIPNDTHDLRRTRSGRPPQRSIFSWKNKRFAMAAAHHSTSTPCPIASCVKSPRRERAPIAQNRRIWRVVALKASRGGSVAPEVLAQPKNYSTMPDERVKVKSGRQGFRENP